MQLEMASRPKVRHVENLAKKGTGPVHSALASLQIPSYTLTLCRCGIDAPPGKLHLSLGCPKRVLDVMREGIEERHVLIICSLLCVDVLHDGDYSRHLAFGVLERRAAHPGPDGCIRVSRDLAFHARHCLAAQ